MNEKTLKAKNGMSALVMTIAAYLLFIAAFVLGCVIVNESFAAGVFLIIVGAAGMCIGWIPLCGLKVLKPQEALVLTLFGKYIGTLKGEGFYFVNPFVSAVNPAAKTTLRQSGDVDSGMTASGQITLNTSVASPSKKLSLKVMTLNNNRQKI
ncbi:MAG: SPFH domain-containing protein, partial [Lachnospiraceae bacterium]|nr:SPFH domain-containing protein [Lachnospiraceae bacterium]